MKRIFLLNVGLSANYKVSWPNIFKIECPFASFENYIPTKKFLTHKSLFHRNHHIFLAQSFYPSCHYSTNTIKVQAKMELTTYCLQSEQKKKSFSHFLVSILPIYYGLKSSFLDTFSISDGSGTTQNRISGYQESVEK